MQMQALHHLLVGRSSERCQRPHTLKVHEEKDRQRERSHRKQCACHRCNPLQCNGPPAASKQCGGGDEPTRHQAKDATHEPQTEVLEGAVAAHGYARHVDADIACGKGVSIG